MKKVVSYKLEEKVNYLFQVTAAVNGETLSSALEKVLLRYIDENKEKVGSLVEKYYIDNEKISDKIKPTIEFYE